MARIVYIITDPSSAEQLARGQLNWFRQLGHDVILIASPGKSLDLVREREGISTFSVPINREISAWADWVAFLRLVRLLRRLRPDIVNASTPKAGLLGVMAAWVAGVPAKLYLQRGLRLETTKGYKKLLLILSERLACASADRVICVSHSLRQKMIDCGLVAPERVTVLGSGTSNGVTPERFAASADKTRKAVELRKALGIPKNAPVLGFVGRLTRDKGIVELVDAFDLLKKQIPEVRLVLLGAYEEGDPVPVPTRARIEADPQITYAGWVKDVTDYYHVFDVLTLPTYREGFPNVLLEAGAAGKPVVATRATGAMDAVVDGVTGLLVPVGDPEALAYACGTLLRDKELATALGTAGQIRVSREFRSEHVWRSLADLYDLFLSERLSQGPLQRPRVYSRRLRHGYLRPENNPRF